MKTSITTMLLSAMLLVFAACTEVAPTDRQLRAGIDSDYEFTYGIREFVQYDPKNPGGINLVPYFDFFKTFSLKFYVVDGKISFLEADMGDLPFDLYPFALPAGKVACYYDEESIPGTLKLADGSVIASFLSGEFVLAFSLDCKDISYKITFKTTETTREGYEKAY